MCEAEAPLPLGQAAETVRAFVSRSDWKGQAAANTPFIGKVYDRGFRIIRVVRGRDSFNPLLYGRFHSSLRGTRLRIFMTFHPLVWLFILGWSAYFAYTLLDGWRINGKIDTGALTFLLAIWVMAVPSFYGAAARSRQLLAECLRPHGFRFGS